MAPYTSFYQMYRMCQDYDLWSPCTIKQVEFFTSKWTRFCPGSFFTYHENPLVIGLLLLSFVAFVALICYCRRKRSCKTKKLLEDEAERLEEEEMVTMVYHRDVNDHRRDLDDVNAAVVQDSISESSLQSESLETETLENP